MPVPLEDNEQAVFVEYLQLKRLKFTAIPNSTFTKSWAVKNRNTRLGVRAGLPDLLVIVPGKVIFIEMKRVKGGQLSKMQKEWIDALNTAGTPAYVAKGADAAIEIVEKYLNPGRQQVKATIWPIF